MKCGYCGYEWTPRVKDPKSCPMCHRYFKQAYIEKVREERRRLKLEEMERDRAEIEALKEAIEKEIQQAKA